MTTVEPTSDPAPRSVVTSSRLHVIGAIIGLVGAVIELVTLPAAIDVAVDTARRVAEGQDTGGVDVTAIATGTAIGSAVLSAVATLVFSILTILFARKMLQGRNWARVVLTVFAGLQLFGILGSYGVGLLHLLVVAAAVVFSFLPTSNAWFRSRKAGPVAV